jgi:hypothetical protein
VDRLPKELVLLALDEGSGRVRGGRPDLDYALAAQLVGAATSQPYQIAPDHWAIAGG